MNEENRTLSVTRLRSWEKDPVTAIFLKAVRSRIEELYLSIVKIQYDDRYDLKAVIPFDMFPRTKHIETLVLLLPTPSPA